jgi:hypothetical protein
MCKNIFRYLAALSIGFSLILPLHVEAASAQMMVTMSVMSAPRETNADEIAMQQPGTGTVGSNYVYHRATETGTASGVVYM